MNSSPITEITGPTKWALNALSLLMRAWLSSLRFTATRESLAALGHTAEPVAFILWHNRLYLVAELARRYRQGRPLHALVSASKDGAYLSAFFALVGIQTVRGSSSQLAREAVTTLIHMLQRGHDIGLTPDGPRGPCYEFKPGALIVARRAHAPMILIGAQFASAWQLSSWDRFYLPKPFSTVHLTIRLQRPESLSGERHPDTQRLQQTLESINPEVPAPTVV